MSIRNPILKCLRALPAAFLAAWCVIFVAGIDVHRDNEHGRTYVVFGFSDSDCEDIHPDSHCHDSDCEEGECGDGESCCSDELLSVLAVGSDDDCIPSIGFKADFWAPTAHLIASSAIHGYPSISRVSSPPPDGATYFSKLSVLRV